ncbi:unnamed protein product [Bathycoccus prasinos]|jgi:hypothetical protein|tara:strand:+ start:1485 stop:2228 length:744 start_codon:yes stop_codon:yes gene_type:complete
MSDDKTIDGFLVRDRDKATTKTTKEESRYEFLLRVIENVKTVAKEQLQRKRFKKNDDDEDKEVELESLETYHDRRKDAQFVLIELRRANRDAMLEMEEKKLNFVERKRKEVEKIGKKVLSAEYEKSHLTMEMQSRQGIATSEDALKFDFVDEETFLKSEKNKNNKMSALTTKNKNAFAERRLEDELERRKELLERIEVAKERKISLQRRKLEREEKKREAENAIKDLKRTAAMVGEKFKTIVHQEKK